MQTCFHHVLRPSDGCLDFGGQLDHRCRGRLMRRRSKQAEVLLTGLRVRQRLHIQLQEGLHQERNERLSRFSNSRSSWLPYPPPSTGLPQQAGVRPVIFGLATLHDPGDACMGAAAASFTASEHLARIGVIEDLHKPPACAHRCSHLPFPLPATLPAKRPLTLPPTRTTTPGSLRGVVGTGALQLERACMQVHDFERATCRGVPIAERRTAMLDHTSNSSPSSTSFSERPRCGRAYVQSRAQSPDPSVGLALQPMTLTLSSVTPTSRLSPVTSTTIGMAEEWSYVRTHELRSTSSSATRRLSAKQRSRKLSASL